MKEYDDHLGDQKLMSKEQKEAKSLVVFGEWQIGWLRWSPGVLLHTKGIDLGNQTCGIDGQLVEQELITQGSALFDVGIDGYAGSTFRLTQLELTTAPMTPGEFLNSTVVDDLKTFYDNVGKPGANIPGSGLQMETNSNDLDYPADLFQINIGFPIEMASNILSKDNIFKEIWEEVSRGATSDNDAYKALVTLAVSMVRTFTGSIDGKCERTKDYIKTWLVKTDLAKLVPYVQKLVGVEAMEKFPSDVISISNVNESATMFPDGVDTYINFPDMAANLAGKSLSTNMSKEAICKMAADMVNHTAEMDEARDASHCTVRLSSGEVADLRQPRWELLRPANPGKWLQNLMQGKNLWSDRGDPLSRQSSTNMLWKSIMDWDPVYPGFVVIESKGKRKWGYKGTGMFDSRDKVPDGFTRLVKFLQGYSNETGNFN
jgi:hypothetical protein